MAPTLGLLIGSQNLRPRPGYGDHQGGDFSITNRIRDAASGALAHLYERAPNVEIFEPADPHIMTVIGPTIGYEICSRLDLQLGQSYEKLKYSPMQIQGLRNDIWEWANGVLADAADSLAVVLTKFGDGL
ncbi:hypothetical protein ACNFBT_23850 [Pseudomonas sp. NY15181]|uniref:hypothetical protein n=1 Tax=Pseudomonas sp. NY15181 TaxID=3400349 RepID=UPI003A8774B4